MAAPDYVPAKAIDDTRIYRAPPWRPGSWTAERPGDLDGPQPRGPALGAPGPDQGYALTVAERFRDRLVLRPGEDTDDALAGAVAVALRRASRFGRAPVVHDVEVALRIWGFLDEDADDELVALRRARFEGLADPHHDLDQRRVADAVPEDVLLLAPGEVASRHAADWRSLLDLPDLLASPG